MPDRNDDTEAHTPPMTRGERIRAAARTLRTPRTASWVADETEVTPKTAQKYLDQLVEDNVLRKIDRGGQTLYCVDQLMATYREIATLQRDHTREELTETLTAIQKKIGSWKDEFDVDSPGELGASIAEIEDGTRMEKRREIASEWEQLAGRIRVIKAALNEYDWAVEQDTVRA